MPQFTTEYVPDSGIRLLATISRYHAERALYAIPMLRRLIGKSKPPLAAGEWDRMMSETNFATYLGDTLEIDMRNDAVSSLLKYNAPSDPSVMDIGCAGGTLALNGYRKYLGIDISQFAIDRAKQDARLIGIAGTSFLVGDIRLIQNDERWDAIVLSELLYYLPVGEAIAQVSRCASWLSKNGVLCISMKDKPKSHAIFSEIMKDHRWIGGILWQAKDFKYDYRVRIDRARPGFIIGVIAPH